MGKTILKVDGLVTGYGKKEIVHGISFEAKQGEFLCVIGANGCGKTTSLKSLMGLIKPFGGKVYVDGQETLRLNERERARHFAYIPQAHSPAFPFCVADVVIMGRTPYISTISRVRPEDRRVAYEAMALLGIQDLADRTYSHLSGGQQQLVLIARALAQQPQVLIMDEPTASLDFGNQQMVLRQMKKLTKTGTTVLMVTHDPDHALYCADHVVAMQKGRILADGTPAEVMTAERLREIYDVKVLVTDVEVSPGVFSKVCIPAEGE